MNLEIKFAGKDHRWIWDAATGDVYATCRPEHAEAIKALLEATIAKGGNLPTDNKDFNAVPTGD